MDAPKRRSNAWVFVVVGALVAVALVGAAAIGARRFQQNREAREAEQRELAMRVTPTSTADATADLVDPDYLVTLKWPGAGFKLIGEADSRRLGSEAIAAAMHESGCSISIIVEQAPGGTPEDVARRVITGAVAQKKKEELFEKTTFHGLPAHHFKMSGEMGGIVYNYDNIIVARAGDWFFQILRTETTMKRGLCDLPLETVITFQEGTIKGRAAVVLPSEANRPLYREKNGLYESAAFGLRVQAPPGGQLIVGEEAAALDVTAAVVVVEQTNAVAITSQALCGDPGPAFLAGQNAATASQLELQLPAKPTHSVKVGAQSVDLYEMTGPAPYTTMLGSAVFGDRLLTLRATYSKIDGETGIGLVQRTASGLALLDKPAIDALARELPARDSQRAVRLGRSLRGGHYVDYGQGLRADLGEEPAQLSLDREPAPLGAKSVLTMSRPRFNVESLIAVSAAGGDLAADHRALAASLLGVTEADLTVDPGAGPKTSKLGYDTQVGVKGRIEIATVSKNATNVHVATWGSRSCVDQAAASTATLVGNVKLENGPIAEAELTPRKVKSERFGFELLLPDGDWKRSEPTLPPAVAGVMTSYELREGGNLIGVMAIHTPKTPDPEFIVGMLEQMFASKLGKRDDKLERTDLRVSGVMGRRLKWSDKLSAVIVAEGGTYFVVMVEKSPLGSLDPEKVFSSFAITP